MSAYVVVQGRIDDRERFDAYRVAANPTVEAYGGRLLGIGDPSEVLEGEQADLPRLVLIAFPSRTAAKRWYGSADYQAVKHLRQISSESRLLLVEGD